MIRFVALLLFCISASTAAQEGGGEKKEPTEESIKAFQEILDGLTKAQKEKSDVDVLHFVKQVPEAFSGADAAQRKSIIELLARSLNSKNIDIRSAAMDSLSRTDASAVRPLLKELNDKDTKDDVTRLCDCITAIGRLAAEPALKDLYKLLNHKENRVIAVVITAISDYSKGELALRKDIVENLLKRYASVASPMTKANPTTSEEERYNALYSSFESSLKRLTAKEGVTGFLEWDKWFRQEGKKAKEW